MVNPRARGRIGGTVERRRVTRNLRRLAILLLAVGAIPSCAPRTPVQRAGEDQEIVRDICWELRKDARFNDVILSCTERVVTLSGRVDLKAFSDEACAIARTRGRGAEVVNRIEVRPR
jgi:osmotically-inducible protein OsmY